MAYVAAIPAIIGGGSAAVGMATLATAAAAVATVATGVSSARASRAAGKAQQAETEIAARAEGDAARQREIERKKNLMRAISSQQAFAGAAGVSARTGSPASLINLDIAEANADRDVDNLNSKTRQRALRFQGANARAAGNAAARTTLLDTTARTAGMFLD